jgi:hypothetical protein
MYSNLGSGVTPRWLFCGLTSVVPLRSDLTTPPFAALFNSRASRFRRGVKSFPGPTFGGFLILE